MDYKSGKNGPAVKKRPEIALYKPGMGKILGKKGDNEPVVGSKSEPNEEPKPEIQQKIELKSDLKQSETKFSNNNKNVSKKPDIKVYVPPKTTAVSDKIISDKSSDKPNQRTNVQNSDKSDKNDKRLQNNQKSGNNRQKSDRNERRDRNERDDRHETNDRPEKPDRRDRYNRTERHERQDRPERNDRNDRHHPKAEKSDRYERHEKYEKSDKNEYQRKERVPQMDRLYERNTSESQNYTKIKNIELKHKTTEQLEVTVDNTEINNRKAKHFESKMSHNFDNNHEMKFQNREEEYDDYYNLDFRHNQNNSKKEKPFMSKIECHNCMESGHSTRQCPTEFDRERVRKHLIESKVKRDGLNKPIQQSTNQQNRTNNSNTANSSGNGINRNDNNYNNSENKSRNKSENNNQRKYVSKPQRYVNTFEQQIPPRFLKLKKQNELMNEKMSEQNPYEQQTSSSYVNPAITPPPSSEPPAHRGLIRLPTNPNDWNVIQASSDNSFSFPTPIHSHVPNPNPTPKPINSNKPCVAIRPTQHVSALNPPQYSPSSSPDTNSNADNYQQMSPYLRQNAYSEYGTTHFMSTTSVENPEISRKKLKPNIEKSLTEAMAAENDLSLFMNDPQKLEQTRYRIQLRYEHIILNDLRVCAEHNIEQRLWKSAFYQFIEHYRKLMDQNSEQQSELKTSLHKIIDESSLFFENLLVKMQETYCFVIEKLLAHEYDSETENYDTLKLASISAQKIYLYLGDLWRYRECETRTSNFVKSKFFYLRAQMLAPKNGRSYNQLALLAMYQNRRLDAVYYYMRSLAASNPFLTARENLLAIFDEVRRKYESNEKKRKQDIINQKKRLEEELQELASDKERIEIWIRSDGTSAVCTNYKQLFEEETDGTKDELESLSSVDLNKRFVLSFLHTHGKLFSRVGMESFVMVVNQMLAEFRSLLRRSPIPVMSQRLSQLLAINMFAVFHTSLKDPTYGQNCRSLLQEQAIQVTFAMISLLLECAINSLNQQNRSETNSDQISADFCELLPTIKLWTDWMSCQKQLWCPPPPPSDFKLDCRGDIWSIFAQFLTLLTKVNVRSVKLLGSKLEGCEPIILPEDTALAGFLPLLGSPQCIQFAQPPYDKEKARTCLRITAIQYFGDYLCGIVEPYLKYDVEKKRYFSLIPTDIRINSVEEIAKTINEFEISETENDEFSNDMSSVETNSSVNTYESNTRTAEQMEIEKLWSLQEKLKKAKDRQDVIKQTVDAVLSEENQRKPSRIIIQPRYIIPDTNCYIDHLDKIKRIIKSKYYDLIVPLIVINELNGLKARGIKTAKPLTFSSDHIGNVGKAASETIDYLFTAFNDKSLRLKAITSKGSLMENINFISESFADSQGNSNDDFILNACLHFIEDKTTDSSKDNPKSVESNSIFRESVLLTDDRNLRVKALGHNVPVKSLKDFIKWANIPFN